MNLYHIASGIKTALGIAVLVITYTSINIYQDPVIGIGLGFLGIFIAARGLSFYVFWGIHKLYSDHRKQETFLKESYKLSLLFGIYMVINFLLIVLGWWSKFLGITLFALFIRMQISLFGKVEQHDDETL